MPQLRQISESGDDICSVCSETIKIFAIGECDHPICFRCSTRMRVLCRENYCPICRRNIPKVVFLRKFSKYDDFSRVKALRFNNYGIFFEDTEIRMAYFDLLKHCCRECSSNKTFSNFKNFEDHLRKEHHRYFCSLCIEHLRIFSYERKYYDREKLALHKRKGDADDTSHRGHPLCEFCERRYLDNDELLRHLRKDHFFCHFCDADGISNQFYSDYLYLHQHFKEEHFLCEEEDCQTAQFTNAFRSEIDLKVHIGETHKNSLGKTQIKNNRHVNVDIHYARREGNRAQGNRGVVTREDYEELSNRRRQRHGKREAMQVAMALTATVQEQGGVGVVNASLMAKVKNVNPASVVPVSESQKSCNKNAQDFPCLGPPSASSAGSVNVGETLANRVALAFNHSVVHGVSSDFPKLNGANVSAVHKQRKSVWDKSKVHSDDYPSLGSIAASLQSSVPSPMQKEVKQIKPPDLHQSLGGKGKPLSFDGKSRLTSTAVEEVNLDEDPKHLEPPNKVREKKKRQKGKKNDCQSMESLEKTNEGKGNKKNDSKDKEHNFSGYPVNEKVNEKVCTGKNKKAEPEQEESVKVVYCDNHKDLPDKFLDISPVKTSKKATPSLESFYKEGYKKKENGIIITKDDFPALPTVRKAAPPGFEESSAPPPGFKIPTSWNVEPPPGYTKLQEEPVYVSCDDKEHTYIEPPQFQERNKILINNIKSFLMSSDGLSKFKSSSGQFRRGEISAFKYYSLCSDLVGPKNFQSIFADLLTLLPDISKQIELLKAHLESDKAKKRGSNKPIIKKGPWLGYDPGFPLCPSCSQVLLETDVPAHLDFHDFPKLG